MFGLIIWSSSYYLDFFWKWTTCTRLFYQVDDENFDVTDSHEETNETPTGETADDTQEDIYLPGVVKQPTYTETNHYVPNQYPDVSDIMPSQSDMWRKSDKVGESGNISIYTYTLTCCKVAKLSILTKHI